MKNKLSQLCFGSEASTALLTEFWGSDQIIMDSYLITEHVADYCAVPWLNRNWENVRLKYPW